MPWPDVAAPTGRREDMTPDDEKTLREVVAKSDAYPVVWGRARRRSLIAYGPALLTLVDSLRSEVEALRGERDAAREAAKRTWSAQSEAILDETRRALSRTTQQALTAEARADSLAGELATLRAAYEGLREAASELSDIFADGFNAADIDSFTVQPIRIALNAAPASLAGKVRAAVLREAAAWCRDQSAVDERLPPEYLADGLLSLAEEAERG